MTYLRQAREKYVTHYRETFRAQRAEHAPNGMCAAEVWIMPNVPPGEPRPPHPLCVDILTGEKERPTMVMVAGEAIEGALMGTLQIGPSTVKVYAAIWEDFPVWFRLTDPDWALLEPWQRKWMNPERDGSQDEDGLSGVVHYLGKPIAEGGGHLFQIDFGSAPIEALLELVEVLAGMGAAEIELGRSDGSDLPAEVCAELRQPEVTMERLMALMMRLFATLPDVQNVVVRGPDQLELQTRPNDHGRQVFLGNLLRLMARTGVEARAREVYRYLRGQRESMYPDQTPNLEQLRLVVKDDRFMEEIRRQAPAAKMLMQKLAADLWLVGVWDAPNGMRFASAEEPGKYGMTPEEMLQRARKNFLENRPAVELAAHGPLLVAQTRDCYDATLLIDDNWWTETASKVQGDLLACVPARHVVLIGGTGTPGTLAQMRQAATRIESGGDHLITSTILIRRDGRWEEFHDLFPPSAFPARTTTPTPAAKRPWWRFW
jgi:hypothetical protein